MSGVQRHDQAHRAERALDVLLSILSKVAIPPSNGLSCAKSDNAPMTMRGNCATNNKKRTITSGGNIMRKLALFALVPFIFAATLASARAEYPDHPIRLIVPQAAGSATDNAARLLGAVLTQELKQQVIIDNRPGGALTIGLDLLAKSPPDGYTIGMGPIGALAITRHMFKTLPYNIERDFQPICLVTRGHLLLAVSPSLPVHSVKELIAYAKAQSRQIVERLVEQRFARPCRRRTVQIHDRHQYRAHPVSRRLAGDPGSDRRPRRPDVREPAIDRAGRAFRQGARARRQRRQRSPAFPDLPTIAEAGVPGYAAPTWTGVIAPAGVPPDRQEAQRRDQQGADLAGLQGKIRKDRRRGWRRHAGRFRRDHQGRFRQMA